MATKFKERVLLTLQRLADKHGELTSNTREIADVMTKDGENDVTPDDVHQAIIALKKDGHFQQADMTGIGGFNLTLG